MAELEDAKEALQIEVSNAATDLAKAGRRYENLKKQALNMQDEFNSTKEDLERERSMREKEKHENESAIAELNNIKQKYREDNRRMKETIQERDDLQNQLATAREQIDRLNKIVEERTQQLSKDKATVEIAYIQERNNLLEQLESINTELRNDRISAARRIQESEESAAAQLKQHIEELRAKASKELERRVAIAVDNALANATSLSEETKQQALTAARLAFNEEKERTSRILQENFNARLQEEIKLAYEKGRQVGLKDSGRNINVNDGGALHQLKEMEFENLKQSYEREIANQKRLISSLSSNAPPAPSKGFSLDEVTQLVRNIVNETFKTIREEFPLDQTYTGEHVTVTVKNILVSKTIGGIPKEEPRSSEPRAHVHTEPEPVHHPTVQSIPIHHPEVTKPTQSTLPEQIVPERFVSAAASTPVSEPEPEQEPEPVVTTQQRFASVPEPEPQSEPVITSEPDLEKQAPPEPEESPDNTAPPKSRFSAFPDTDSDSDNDVFSNTKTETHQTPEPSTSVSHQNPESPASEKTVTTETKPEEALTEKSQNTDKSEDKQDETQDWDDDEEEEPAKPEPQSAASQPAAVPTGPPPVKSNAFSFLDDSDDDEDPFFTSSKKKTTDDHDPFDFGSSKKNEDTTKSKTSNGTSSASTISDPLEVPASTKEKTTTTTKDTAATSSDWMYGETPKDNPLGDIFGSSDKSKTTTSSSTAKKGKSAFDDDEEEDDFLGGFKDPILSSKKTEAKDPWADDDGSDLFG